LIGHINRSQRHNAEKAIKQVPSIHKEPEANAIVTGILSCGASSCGWLGVGPDTITGAGTKNNSAQSNETTT
jgi:hypothetical protein